MATPPSKESVLAGVAERLPITEGAERLIANLKRLGYKVAILSGGFTYFAEYLQRPGVEVQRALLCQFCIRVATGLNLDADLRCHGWRDRTRCPDSAPALIGTSDHIRNPYPCDGLGW